MKKSFIIYLLFICLGILFACGKGTTDTEYYDESPPVSKGLEEYLKHYVSSNVAYHLMTVDGVNIYAMMNVSRDQNSIEYIEFCDDELTDTYHKQLKSKEPKAAFEQLREEKYSLFQEIDNKEKYNLPEIKMESENILHIKTTEDDKKIKLTDLLEDYDVKKDDYIIMNVVAANEDGFQIDLEIEREGEASSMYVSLFMTIDLQQILAFETDTKEFIDSLDEGEFESLRSLLTTLDDEDRYITAANGSVIADTKEKILRSINESDYLSHDNGYVYLNGRADPLLEGKQRIQHIDEYFAESDKYVMEFDLNFKEISDELDLKSVDDISLGNVKYVEEDFAVIFLHFKGAITGEAGSINVFMDFQDDPEKPDMYLIETD